MALRKAALLGAAFLLLLGACAGPGGSRESAVQWSASSGFRPLPVEADGFQLFSLLRNGGDETLTIYIEGDGAAWATPFHPPRDPTPHRSTTLQMARNDRSPSVAYLARPCQYLDAAALASCPARLWIEHRFSPEAVAAMGQAVDRLKLAAGARRLRLVGHSGGGVIAALLAAERRDVSLLVTVAAPLALTDWAKAQDLSPLDGSLDPMALPIRPDAAPALHLAGADDRVVPPGIIARHVRKHGGRLQIVEGFGHECCWESGWQSRIEGAIRDLEFRR